MSQLNFKIFKTTTKNINTAFETDKINKISGNVIEKGNKLEASYEYV